MSSLKLQTTFICVLFGVFALHGPKAFAKEVAHAAARSACIAQSLKLGNPGLLKAQQCFEKEAQHYAQIKRSQKNTLGRGLDAQLRSSACPSYFSIDKVPRIDEAGDETESKLTKSYLERFQKRLIPYGKNVAECYTSLAKNTLKPSQFKKGRVVVELEVASTGRAKQVILTEKTTLDGHVAGCVVRELCGLWASPPPGGSFYLELPFNFKKPKL